MSQLSDHSQEYYPDPDQLSQTVILKMYGNIKETSAHSTHYHCSTGREVLFSHYRAGLSLGTLAFQQGAHCFGDRQRMLGC